MNIAGKELNKKKIAYVGLTYIRGIGISTAKKICSKFDISMGQRIADISPEKGKDISNYIQANYKVEEEHKNLLIDHYKKCLEIGLRSAERKRKGLSIKGRTRNCKTSRKGLSFGRTGKKLRTVKMINRGASV